MKIYKLVAYKRYDDQLFTYSLEKPINCDKFWEVGIDISERKLDKLAEMYQYGEQDFLRALYTEGVSAVYAKLEVEKQCRYNKLVARIKSYLF